MKPILLIVALCCAASGAAQDFFGNLAPLSEQKKEEKKISLPDKPNATDSQGRKQGEWARKYPNGRYRYVATFVDNQPVGTTTRYNENGTKSATLTYDSLGTCHAELFNEEGKLTATGLYASEKRIGLWKSFTNNGKLLSTENYKDGILHGQAITYFPTGEKHSESFFANGEKEGIETEYYRNGRKRCITTYHLGICHGEFKFWEEGGRLTIDGKYKNGHRIGNWKMIDATTGESFVMRYDNNGKLLNHNDILEREQKQFELDERNRQKLVDPEDFTQNPEEYRP